MKKFKFKTSGTVIAVLIILILISLIGIALNVFNIIEYLKLGSNGTFRVVTFSIVIFVALTVIVLSLFALCNSYYTIKGNKLCLYIGLIPFKTNIDDIVEFNYFKKQEKLVMYLKDNKYTIIVIDQKDNEDFVFTLREVNKNIIYENKTSNNEID